MATAKAAVASRLLSLESELAAAHQAGQELRAQLEDRERIIKALYSEMDRGASSWMNAKYHTAPLRAVPDVTLASSSDQGFHTSGIASQFKEALSGPDGSPAASVVPQPLEQQGGGLNFKDFVRRGGRSPHAPADKSSHFRSDLIISPSRPTALVASSMASPLQSQGMKLPHGDGMDTEGRGTIASEASAQIHSGHMRKSVQSLLARVNDMTQFVVGTSSPNRASIGENHLGGTALSNAPTGWGASHSDFQAQHIATRLTGLSDALDAWNITSQENV